MHLLDSSIYVPAPIDRVWDFFSDPQNLVRITPPRMRLALTPGAPRRTVAGSRLDFRLRLFGLPLRWRSLIEEWDPQRSFVDRQLSGPYRYWRHQHRFEADGEGTWIHDTVEYELPFGPLGRVVERLSVRRMLGRLFAYRSQAARRLLGGAPDAP